MKIAFDVAQTCSERAGCGWYADGLARALARHPGVTLDLYHHFGDWWNESTTTGTHLPGVAEPTAHLDYEGGRTFWRDVVSAGLPGRPDFIWSASAFEAPAAPGPPVVFTVHDLSFWSHPQFATSETFLHCQRGLLDALERAEAFVFVSQAARLEFEHVLPGWLVENGRPTAIVPGASRFAMAPGEENNGSGSAAGELSADAPWLCVAAIEPRKNHRTLLDAYRRYRCAVSQPRELWLAGGRGWGSDDIHARLADGSCEGIRHLGYVPDEQLERLYRAAHAVIQPSWHEGFGLPVVEAMGFGRPVIGSDIPAHREVGGGAPMFVPPADAQALADAMVALDHDTALHAAMHVASLERARAFSWDASAATAVRFLQLLKTKPVP